jgi:hypothetical protein
VGGERGKENGDKNDQSILYTYGNFIMKPIKMYQKENIHIITNIQKYAKSRRKGKICN